MSGGINRQTLRNFSVSYSEHERGFIKLNTDLSYAIHLLQENIHLNNICDICRKESQ